MVPTTTEGQRAELHRTIWRIANDLRGSVDGWDFKAYVLGMLFYRFISENLTAYINADGDDDYAELPDAVAERGMRGIIEEKGFFIFPSELFVNVRARAAQDANLNETLARVFRNIQGSAMGQSSERALKGLFDDLDVNSSKLGPTIPRRNEKLVKLLNAIGDLPLGSFEDNSIDLFGDAYEYLMQMYASQAGKSGGEYYTPPEVSEVLARLTVVGRKSKADLAFTMHILSWLAVNGTAAIVEFPGVLYRGGAEQKIRKYLVDNNYVDAVIQLPQDLFFGTTIATCIIVLKKSKPSNDVLFIDASAEFSRVGNKNKLQPEHQQRILELFTAREEVPHVASLVSNEEIGEGDYNLSVSAHVEKEDTREAVDITELNAEIARIVARQAELLLYRRDDGTAALEVRLVDESLWLSQQQIAELFQTSRTNVVEHLRNIYAEGELEESATCRRFRQVRTEGSRQVTRDIRSSEKVLYRQVLDLYDTSVA